VQCEWFFSSWDEDVYVPVDEETDEATPISSMNREMLAKAESLGTYVVFYISSTVSTTAASPQNTGHLLEFEIVPENTGNVLEFSRFLQT